MGSKDAPQKMQFLGTITQKVASLCAFITTQKWRETPTYPAVTKAK